MVVEYRVLQSHLDSDEGTKKLAHPVNQKLLSQLQPEQVEEIFEKSRS